MFKVDTINLKRYEQDLKVFAERAYPFATKATVNSAAFATQKESRRNIKRQMIERVRFSQQSIRSIRRGPYGYRARQPLWALLPTTWRCRSSAALS